MKRIVTLFNPSEKEDHDAYLEEVLCGLSQPLKLIPLKFIYDEEGSKLFTKINASQTYYPCKCEMELFQTWGGEMLKLMGGGKFNLVDLGAGDASKTRILLQRGLEEKYDFEYIPLDISHDANVDLLTRFEREFPSLPVTALTSQFEEGIQWVQKNKSEKNVYLFVGGTFGNFTLEENERFAKFAGCHLKKGDLLFVGLDKMKDPEVILQAYVGSEHGKILLVNLLKRLNKDLGADFEVEQFTPFIYFEPFSHCIVMSLISKRRQSVTIQGQVFEFQEAEVIKVGNSRKWLMQQAMDLFKLGDLQKIGVFEDSKKYFTYAAFEKL